jgi:hypothetical protein
MEWYKLLDNGGRILIKLWLGVITSQVKQIPVFIKKAKGDEPQSFVIIYVDDGGIIGTPEAIKEVIEPLSKSIKVRTMREMSKFDGCIWIHQPKLFKNLKGKFKHLLEENTRVFKTPSAPKTLIICPKDSDPLILPEKQKQFMMGIGMLLYLVKHSCPDISNSVRELSKVEDGATECHFTEVLRTIKYVIGPEDHGLLLKPKVNNNGFYLERISGS